MPLPPNFDNRLLKFLEKAAEKERMAKQPKIQGTVRDIKHTKNSNILIIVYNGKYEEAVLVNKNNTSMFELAKKLNVNDEIYARGNRGIKVLFCEVLKIIKARGVGLERFN